MTDVLSAMTMMGTVYAIYRVVYFLVCVDIQIEIWRKRCD